MKVLTMISGGDVGGAKTHVLSLLRELNKVIGVELVCFRDGEFAQDAREMDIPTVIVSHGSLTKDLRELRRRVSEGGFELIHCHGARANFMGSLLKKKLGIPILTTVHSDPKLDYMGRPAGRLVYGTLNAAALRRLDYYVGVSDSMAELLISRGFKPDRVFTIYNGIDFSGEDPQRPQERREYRASLGFDDGCVVAGIAARLNPVKDIATLVRGFAAALERAPSLRLAIAGDGEQRGMLEALAAELGVTEKIRFLGWVEDMTSFYRAIDINTLTSLSETFPYALTEGARQWLPTVSSRVGGVPRLIDHGHSGFLFNPGDAAELAEHLARLGSDAELRKTMGRALGEKARHEFSLEATRDTQLDIYETVLRRYRRAKERKRDGVLICGAYGRGNAGDDAILEAVIREMRGIDPDLPLTVLSKDPAETQQVYRVPAVYTFDVPEFRRVMKKTRLYINGGGSLIQDVTSRRSLYFYLYNISSAKKLGNRVIMYGCGIGPVLYEADRRRAARVLNRCVDTITLRESSSRRELELMGVNRPEILEAADPSLILGTAPEARVDALLTSAGVPPQGRYIGFALRKWSGFEDKLPLFAAAADHAYEKYGLTTVFLPIDHTKDVAAAQRVAALMRAPCYSIEQTMTSGETIGVMSRMTAVVSMRLHGLIFAAGNGIPLVGVVYDPKVSAFLRHIGQELYCELNELEDGTLPALIDAAVRRSADREELVLAAQRLLEKEKINVEAARRLLQEE